MAILWLLVHLVVLAWWSFLLVVQILLKLLDWTGLLFDVRRNNFNNKI